MDESILSSIKLALGISPELDVFDEDVLLYINSGFTNMLDVGLGPEDGFSVTDYSQTWDSFGEPVKILSQVKTYILMYVRQLFDPPQTGPLNEVITKQLGEWLWRLAERKEFNG